MFLQTAVLYLTANNDPESLEDVLRWAKKSTIRMKTETIQISKIPFADGGKIKGWRLNGKKMAMRKKSGEGTQSQSPPCRVMSLAQRCCTDLGNSPYTPISVPKRKPPSRQSRLLFQ